MNPKKRLLKDLHDCLVKHGSDLKEGELQQLRALAKAPAALTGWTDFFKGLPKILIALEALYPPSHEWPLQAWSDAAMLYLSDEGAPCRDIAGHALAGSTSGASAGALNTFGVYGALSVQVRPEHEPGIRILQGLLIALHRVHLAGTEQGNQLEILGRTIRLCSRNKPEYLPLAKLLPSHLGHSSELVQLLEGTRFQSSTLDGSRKTILSALAAISRHPVPALSMAGSSPNHKSTAFGESRQPLRRLQGVDDGTDQRLSPTLPSGGLMEAGDIQAQGEELDSRPTRYAYAEGRPVPAGSYRPSFQVDLVEAKSVQRAVARANQRLPSDWRLPTPHDISVVLVALGTDGGLLKCQLSPEARLAVLLMVCCGSAAAELQVVSVIDRFPVQSTGITLGLLDRVWVRPLPIPADCYQPTNHDSKYLDPTAPTLQLPAPEMFVSAAKALLPSGGVFRASESALSNACAWFRMLNKHHGTRLTTGRVSRSIQSALNRITDDSVEIALLTGDADDSRHSGLYYYSPQSERLVTLYCDAWQRLFEDIDSSDEQGLCGLDATNRLHNSRRVGTPLHPSSAALARFTELAKKWVNDKPARLRSRTETARYHNRFTVYTATLLQFATGARPVRSFLAKSQDVQYQSHTVLISDKDYYDAPSTRLVPLPDIALQQITQFKKHAATLRNRLPLIKFPTQGAESPLLFLIDRRGNPIDVTPGALTEHRSDIWSLPGNTHRHWYRTALREAGVPGEMVDSVMGHARYMQGTYDPYSALPPSYLVEVIAPIINQLLVEMGWEALRGLYD